MSGEMNARLQKLLLGFASGVLIAASVWSLLIPSIEMAETAGTTAWVPALVVFLIGIGFLLVLDTVIPHLHLSALRIRSLQAATTTLRGQPKLSSFP